MTYGDLTDYQRGAVVGAYQDALANGETSSDVLVGDWFDSLSADQQGSLIGGNSGNGIVVTGAGGGSGGAGSTTGGKGGSKSNWQNPRMQDDVGTDGGPLPPSVLTGSPKSSSPDPAATGSGSGSGGSDTYSSSGSSGKSAGSGSGSGSGQSDAVPEMPPFPGGGFGTPNVYPTLPMTDIRRKTLEALSVPFGPNVGQFRAPGAGWREDMAPMFTTGAFGGLGQAAPAPAPSPTPASFSMPSMPAMPTPSAPAMPDMSMMQAAQPAPMAMPEIDPQTGMPVLPPFNRPGVASPAAMDRMPGYFARGTMPKLPGTAANKTTAPPLPPSIAKRFGF